MGPGLGLQKGSKSEEGLQQRRPLSRGVIAGDTVGGLGRTRLLAGRKPRTVCPRRQEQAQAREEGDLRQGRCPCWTPGHREEFKTAVQGLRDPQDHQEDGPGGAACCLPHKDALSADAHVLRGVRTAGTSGTLYGTRAGGGRTGFLLPCHPTASWYSSAPQGHHLRAWQAPPSATSRPFGQSWRTGGDCDTTSLYDHPHSWPRAP